MHVFVMGEREDIFYDIENIIHSMSQECLTSVNLINESLEVFNMDSLSLIESLEEDLNDNQLLIDSLTYKILSIECKKKYDMSAIWIYTNVADKFYFIGKSCMNTVYHLKKIFSFIDENVDISNIIAFSTHVQNVLMKVSASFFEKDKQRAQTIFNEGVHILEKEKDQIMETLLTRMNLNSGFLPIYTEIIFITKSMYRIGKTCFTIAENTIELKEDM